MSNIIPNRLIVKEIVNSETSSNTYEVSVYDNCICCTCPAGCKKQICKHMVEVIHKNFDKIKAEVPEFSKELMRIIEIKLNTDIPKEEKMKEYEKIIFLNKTIAQESIKNIQRVENSNIKNNASLYQRNIKNIDSTSIYAQFELFKLICLTYNKKDIGFRYTELPDSLKPYINSGILVNSECSDLKNFHKMDKGRKSIYFFKFSHDVQPFLKKIHDYLSPKFPKVKKFLDDEKLLFVEERIIDPVYLDIKDR